MMEVGLVGSKENCTEVDFFPKKVPESCRCSELEERSRISEAKCLELERQNGLLRRRVEELEKENELKVLKRGNGELNQQAEDEDEDDIVEAAMEFGSRTETPYIGTPCIVGEDGRSGSRCQLKLGKVKKCLALKEDGKGSKKLAPSTTGVAMPASSIIIIFDSDDEHELACGNMHPENGKSKTDSLLEGTRVNEMEIKDVTCQNSNDEDSLEDFAPSSLTPRQRRVRKIVTSESESENGVTRPASSIVNIFYSDDKPELACRKTHPENGKRRTDSLLEETRESEMEIKDGKCQNFDVVEDSLEDCAPSSLTPRRGRRRVRKIVTSESESENGDDDDDNIPISQRFKSHIQKEHSNDTTSKLRDNHVDLTRDDNVLISKLLNSHIQKEHSDDASSNLHDESMDPTLPGPGKSRSSSRIKKRRRLVKTREIQGNGTSQNAQSNCCRGIPDTEEIKDDSEEGFSENDDASMDDFIVDVDSGEEDVEDGDSGSEQEDASDDSGAKTDNALHNLSDDDETYPEIISRFRRKKVNKSVWESEGDMLVAFNEFPEVCMRAVCALYRKQTEDERDTKETIHQNGEGFNQPDAERGTTLGEYLLGGNPFNNMEMTAEEFEASHPGGVSSCEDLARRYSKQLFEMYRNNEDPDFHPVIPDDTEEFRTKLLPEN